MIFNKSGRKLKGYAFIYAQQSIGQASEYKYLGIIFKPSPWSGSFLQMYMQPISYKKKKDMQSNVLHTQIFIVW